MHFRLIYIKDLLIYIAITKIRYQDKIITLRNMFRQGKRNFSLFAGSSDDWAKGVASIKYAYTIELRDRGTYGFLLPATQIVPTAREIWAGIRAIARLVTCNT